MERPPPVSIKLYYYYRSKCASQITQHQSSQSLTMVSTFRQTRLGLSATGQLSLVMPRSFTAYPDLEPQRRLLESGPNRSKRSAERNTQALILQLPTELLHQCIQAVHDMDLRLSEDPQYYDEYRWGEDDTDDESRQGDHEDFAHNLPQAATKIHIRYAAIYATSLTCKQFHAIAVPMLYARPRFDAPHFEPNLSPQCDKFYGTIQRHSALRPFVKHLALQDKNFHHEYVRKCLRFPNLKSLLLVYPRYEDEDEQGEGPSPVRKHPRHRRLHVHSLMNLRKKRALRL